MLDISFKNNTEYSFPMITRDVPEEKSTSLESKNELSFCAWLKAERFYKMVQIMQFISTNSGNIKYIGLGSK